MKQDNKRIYSGAGPEQVAADVRPLIDFQEEGMSLKALSGLINRRLVPHLVKYDLPGFQSLFNSFPEKGAKLGAEIALAFNQGVTNWQVSPGGAMLEELCCQALCRLFGFSAEADATFMYSGTYANQEALYLALHKKGEDCGFNFAEKGIKGFSDPARLTVLASEDVHFSIKHAVRILGLGDQSLLTLDVDKNRRIDIERAEKRLADIQKSRDIFCLVATAGTTLTGAVDPILPLVDICRKYGIWLHVDGAYGLAYRWVPKWQSLFCGIERSDSVSWDPHKQLGIPIPNSLLFVARREDFRRMTIHSGYFNRPEETVPNPGLKSPPSTRPFAALPLVASLRYQGLKAVRKRLEAPLAAMRSLAEHLAKASDIQLLHRPDTGILCFRLRPPDCPENRIDDLQQYIYQQILAEGKRSISLIRLNTQSALRLVALSPAVSLAALLETIGQVRGVACASPLLT
jgi:L-2,4-diaminobutyrate decarboxylase